MNKVYRIYNYQYAIDGWQKMEDLGYIVAKNEEQVKEELEEKYGKDFYKDVFFTEIELKELRNKILDLEIQIHLDNQMLDLMKSCEVEAE